MKKVLIAAASMLGIIVIRMLLSITFSEQAAEVFVRTSVSLLFFYFILSLSRQLKAKHQTISEKTGM